MLWQDYQTKKETARLAAQNLFTDEPLPAVGSDIWRTLWEAARAYSTEAPYPEHLFPFTDDEARCVLCQQALAPEAADRLRRFEHFVQDRTQQDEIEAQRAFQEYESALAHTAVSIAELHEAFVLIRDELGQAALANLVRSFAVKARWRLRHLFRYRTAPATPVPPFPEVVLRAGPGPDRLSG